MDFCGGDGGSSLQNVSFVERGDKEKFDQAIMTISYYSLITTLT